MKSIIINDWDWLLEEIFVTINNGVVEFRYPDRGHYFCFSIEPKDARRLKNLLEEFLKE